MSTLAEFVKSFAVSRNTVRSWSAEFADNLSAGANPGKGKPRRYTDDDGRVLALIADMRQQSATYDEIHAALDDGQLGEWPPMAEPETARPDDEEPAPGPGSEIVMRLTATVSRYEGELTAVKDERDRLVDELATEREARRKAEIGEAKAEAKLEQYTESAVINVVHSQAVQDGAEDDRPWWKFWERP